MPDVLLDNDDITVLGPPETIELLTDVGATGTRGSQVFVGLGNPNVISIGQTPLLNDLYINISPGANYGYLYQYVSQAGANTWIGVLGLNPTIYSVNYTTTYVAASMSIPALVGDGEDLVINFKAVEHRTDVDSGPYGDWAVLEGQVTTHLLITIVDEES